MKLLEKVYLTEARALKEGYTHWGSMYGAKCYLKDLDTDIPSVAPVTLFGDWWVQFGSFVVNTFFPGEGFPIHIKGEIYEENPRG